MDSAFLTDQLEREQRNDPWHGPSMAAVLEPVDAEAAAAHPAPGAHSIWEIVLHLTAWNREVTRRLRDGDARDPADGDWPIVPATPTDGAWRDALSRLRASQDELRAAIEALSPERWAARISGPRDPALGTGITNREMLYGVLQHEAYHTGQMALLAKAAVTGADRGRI